METILYPITNLNPYHCKLKSILTPKQKYNSKFQEYKTFRTLEILNYLLS